MQQTPVGDWVQMQARFDILRWHISEETRLGIRGMQMKRDSNPILPGL